MSDATNTLELGNYRVLHREDGTLWALGKGSYGTTYKGEHKHLRRICALKVINDHLVRNDQAKMRFLQEAQAAASLDHEHIARIYDFGEADGLFYYAMTYCAGGDLEEYATRNGAQSWPVVKELARQILGALGKAHEEGLLHRDLKPSNVMLASPDEPVSLRLIDFGLVKALDPGDPSETAQMRTQEGAFMGNPMTASPEQFREEDLDERSDLFSVGITLWYLLVGGSPFGKTSAAQIAQQRLSISGYDNLLPAGLDPEARWVLNRLLATDRNARFRSAGEVLLALDGGESDAGAGASAVSSEPRPETKNLDEQWALGGMVRQFEYGSYYSCSHKTNPEVAPSTLFIPEPQGPSFARVAAGADRMTGQQVEHLCGFFSKGLMDGSQAYLCESLPNGSYQTLLQEAGRLTLKEDGAFLAQVAQALDGALALGLPGLEMGDTEVLIGLDPVLGVRLVDEGQWREYFRSGARADGSRTAGLRVTLLPRLGDEGAHREASSTIGGDDLATNPVARFGAFLYRALSGMSVKQSAYLTAVNHVSFSDISEDSNRYLSEVIAALVEPASAWEVLQRLCDFEGCAIAGHRPDPGLSHGMPDPSVTLSAPVKPVPPPVVPVAPSASASAPLVSAAQMASSLPPSASATMPPPVAAVPQATHPPVSGKKGKLLPIVLGVVILALAGGGYYYFQENRNRSVTGDTVVELPKETGDGALEFGSFEVVGGLPDGVPLALGDARGVAVGSFELGGDAATVKKFPRAVFDESDRWPLRFVSLDSRYLVEGPKIEKSAFKGRDGDRPSYRGSLKLKVLQFLDLVPEISVGGEPFDDTLILSRYIRPDLDSTEFEVSPHEGGLRVTLSRDGDFPVTASLRVPGAKPAELVFDRDSTPSVDLAMRERDLKIAGLTSGMTLRFEPDLSQVEDESIREIYEKLGGDRSTTAREVIGNDDSWTLPWIPGSIVLEKGGRAGRILVTHDSEFMVVAGLTNRLEVEDPETARLRDLAERGKIVDQYNLGLRYYKEYDGQDADGLAYGWMRLAAERGDPPAQYSLGLMYRMGTGVQRDEQEMVRWFRKAAENGHPGGMNHYGLCFRFGSGVEQDDRTAEDWFKKSADEQDAFAMNNLGLLYLDDESELHNPAESLKWLKQSSDAGNAEATYNLAYTYHSGAAGVEDLEKAKELYQAAVDAGYEKAKIGLRQLDK